MGDTMNDRPEQPRDQTTQAQGNATTIPEHRMIHFFAHDLSLVDYRDLAKLIDMRDEFNEILRRIAPISVEHNFRLRRREIDAIINTVNLLVLAPQGTLEPKNSREVSLAYTNLQRGFHWLGKALGAFHSTMFPLPEGWTKASPYPNANKPENTVIDPRAEADAENTILPEMEARGFAGDPVRANKFIRSKISDIIDSLNAISKHTPPAPLKYVNQSIFALEDARMWLGWELERISKEERISKGKQ